MFSLADQIQKFQSVTLTLPDNVITLDERFLGGGVKMQDLIQQNSFIINQMRKFKSIFLNYCKLNDKIYKKIVQHQVNANEHFQKVYTVSAAIDRKIQQSDKEMKKIKEDINMQISKLKESMENSTKSLKQQMTQKVGQQNFVQRVKKIIQIYQQQNASSSLPSDNQSRANLNINGGVSPLAGGNKKRRGLTVEDIQLFKSQITPLIDQTNQKLNIQTIRLSQCTSSLNIHSNRFQKIQQQTKWITQDIAVIRRNIDEVQNLSVVQDKKIIEMLRQTINENVWTQKLESFNQRFVLPQIDKLNEKFYSKVQGLKKQVDQNVKPKFIQFNNQFLKIKNKFKQVQNKIIKTQQKFPTIQSKIQQSKQQVMKKIFQQSRKHEKHISEIIAQRKSQTHKLQNNIKSIDKTIKQIVNTTEQAVLKKVENKIGKEMKEIKGDIVTLNRRASQINSNVKFNGQQVKHVKDVVATKANYSDLVVYFDKKADKQEFKQLQQLFTDSPKGSHQNWTQQGQIKYQNIRRSTEEKKKRRSSYSKRMTTPIYTKPQEDPGRFLLVGWDTPQNKQSIKNTLKNSQQNLGPKIRNKPIRPSTANTLFLL